jgi:hypothetical protein
MSLYSNVKDGSTSPDDDAVELALSAARRDALDRASRILADSERSVWNGQPCCMWVPDQPKALETLSPRIFPSDGGGPP